MIADSSYRTVLKLTACMALHQTALTLGFTVAALAGQMLAGAEEALATLPLSIMFIVLMASSAPVSLLMGRIGRRAGFALGTLVGAAGAAIAAYAIYQASLWLFALGIGLYGYATATANYYRFAASEVVSDAQRSRAISTVLTGGVVAAVLGPFLATRAVDWLAPFSFAASYLVMAGLALAIVPLLLFLRLPTTKQLAAAQALDSNAAPARPLSEIARQPVFIVAALAAMVGFGAMNLIMVTTPLAVVACGYGVVDAGAVIQWHVLGMYLPSFVTGRLIQRFGVLRIMAIGAALILGCVAVNVSGVLLVNFIAGLILLGVGWNFLYIGGSTLVTSAFRPQERARTLGLFELMVTGTTAVTALSSGAIYAAAGWEVLNLAAVLPLLLVLAAVVWLGLQRRAQAATV